MNDNPNDQPLWRVMEAAFIEGRKPGFCDAHAYAAVIRALADIIEQRGAKGLDLDPGETADWLRAEAVRVTLQEGAND